MHRTVLLVVAALAAPLVVPPAAGAENPAQFAVAKERVIREAVKLQRRGKYRVGNRTITPKAYWLLNGTTQTGEVVTMRWRIRVKQNPRVHAGELICRGRVTVRGNPADPASLRASLATDTCIA